MTTTEILTRNFILGFSAFVVGMCCYMDARHLFDLIARRRSWHVWFVMIYAGVAIIVALIAELIFGVPGVPLTWRTVLYVTGLVLIFVGMVGVAWSVGKRNKRWTDKRE